MCPHNVFLKFLSSYLEVLSVELRPYISCPFCLSLRPRWEHYIHFRFLSVRLAGFVGYMEEKEIYEQY